jgi:hypothetical protein
MRITSRFLAAAVIAAAGAMLLQRSAERRAPPTGSSEPEPAIVASAPIDSPIVRVEDRQAPQAVAGCRSFADILDALVALGVQANEALAAKDEAVVHSLRPQVESLRAELERCVPDAPERALLALGEIRGDDMAATVRRGICLGLVQVGLELRERERSASGNRASLDALVHGILAILPHDERLTRDLGSLLESRPYLGLAHEEAVLGLVAASGEQPFLVPIASALLLTLWRNLEAEGARTPGEIASLALLFKDDANQGRRLTALRHLLVAHGGRFRDLVVQDIVARRDRALALSIGAAAAEDLPGAQALDIIERLVDIGGPHMLPAFLTLGARDAAALRQRYDQALAANLAPALRAELVTGGGFQSEGGIDLARNAFDLDPDPAVRARAMLVLTSRAGEALGAAALTAMLDDPVVGHDPAQLGQVILGLENLIGRCNPDVIARIGGRLQSRKLLPGDRKLLDSVLARAVPGGGR